MLFNNTSKIIYYKELLSIDYVPQKIIGREEEIKELSFHLSYLFRENPSLPQIIVYGSVGTGKTSTILYILRELEKEAKKKNQVKLRIVKVKCSESKSKYGVLKSILEQISPGNKVSNVTVDVYNQIVREISEKGYYLLIFLDEVHELKDNDLNNTLYSISRLGQDVGFLDTDSQGKIEKIEKGKVGYIIVSNDANIRNKLKDNTKSSLTRESIIFKRYSIGEIIDILKDRITLGALYENTIEDGVLPYIASASIKEGQDARYALILLSNSAKETEKSGLPKINTKIVENINHLLIQDYMKQLIRDMPDLYLEVLLIAYQLNSIKAKINSKEIYSIYETKSSKGEINPYDYSRISQVVTALEKDNIVYVTQSKKTRLRDLSIEENFKEIEDVLRERGKI